MELGEKIRQARLEAGMSQRQLCGDEITRNMLSLIENGSAKPSMKTLQYLAARLEKSVSFFLEDTALLSPNQPLMAALRQAFDTGAFSEAASLLEQYRAPDPVFDREMELLSCLTFLALAENAISDHRHRYALELLEKANCETAYCSTELHRKKLLLLGQLPGQQVAEKLPTLDDELLLRAEETLSAGNTSRAAAYLDAMEEHTLPHRQLLRGRCYLAEKDYAAAARCFHCAEPAFPKEAAPMLEQCYRELQDYKRAYEYACKQK